MTGWETDGKKNGSGGWGGVRWGLEVGVGCGDRTKVCSLFWIALWGMLKVFWHSLIDTFFFSFLLFCSFGLLCRKKSEGQSLFSSDGVILTVTVSLTCLYWDLLTGVGQDSACRLQPPPDGPSLVSPHRSATCAWRRHRLRVWRVAVAATHGHCFIAALLITRRSQPAQRCMWTAN